MGDGKGEWMVSKCVALTVKHQKRAIMVWVGFAVDKLTLNLKLYI